MSCNKQNACGNCSNSCGNEEVHQGIPEFEAGKDYAVGSFVKIGNEVYKVIDASEYSAEEDCEKCDFNSTEYCWLGKCGTYEREDTTSVEFILYDTLE